MSLFFEGFQPQNILNLFSFSMKHSYLLEKLQNCNQKLIFFMSNTKISENVTNNLICCFSKQIYNLAHQTKYKHVEQQFASCKEYLLALLFSRNVKKTHTDQRIVRFFYSLRKERTHKPSKVAAAETFFCSMYFIDTACFDECFFLRVNWKTLFFYKSLSLL